MQWPIVALDALVRLTLLAATAVVLAVLLAGCGTRLDGVSLPIPSLDFELRDGRAVLEWDKPSASSSNSPQPTPLAAPVTR
jgi:hypothetical protein